MIRTTIVTRPIDAAALLDEVAHPSTGATSLFVGTVREVNDDRGVTGIDYEAYAGMAARELETIANEAAAKFAGVRVALEHRVGTLAVGDVSVAIAVAHARRGAAMDASRFVIEELKRRVPIWKREHYVDGTREWVDPSRAPQRAAGAV